MQDVLGKDVSELVGVANQLETYAMKGKQHLILPGLPEETRGWIAQRQHLHISLNMENSSWSLTRAFTPIGYGSWCCKALYRLPQRKITTFTAINPAIYSGDLH